MALSKDQVKNICKFGCGKETCSYLSIGADGFTCMKGTELEELIKVRRATGQMRAMGDHCPGKEEN